MKVITEKEFNKVIQQEMTSVYVEMNDGKKELWGRLWTSNTPKIMEATAQARKWIAENE